MLPHAFFVMKQEQARALNSVAKLLILFLSFFVLSVVVYSVWIFLLVVIVLHLLYSLACRYELVI